MALTPRDFLENLQTIFSNQNKEMYKFHERFFNDYHELIHNVNKRATARRLVEIVEGEEYQKETFFAIQCIETNTSDCEIETEFGSVVFPPNSFFKAAIYPINILRIKNSGGGKFIGYVSQ